MTRHRQNERLYAVEYETLSGLVSALTVEFPPWLDGRALCAQTDPELFFPEAGGRSDVSGPKRICSECPLLAACREHALKTRPAYGIFGGMTPRERQAENRRRKKNLRKAS